MFVAFIIFISLFAIASVINIISGFFEKEKIRRVSKPFCLLFLGIAACIILPKYFLIYVGCFLGSLGDFLLLYKNNKICLCGGLMSFLLGHICYIGHTIVYLSTNNLLPWWSYLVMAGAFVLLLILVIAPIYGLTKHSKLFTIPGSFYCATLLFSIGIAGLGVYFIGPHLYLLVLFGTMLFFASDLILVTTLFAHDFPRRDFYIMLTYLLAQAGIVLGFIFTII